MALITINLSYYNQSKEVLEKHLILWNQYPDNIKKQYIFFIIDDASQTSMIDLINPELIKNLNIHFYRVLEDLYCNISGVRNLGSRECQTPYLVILDMDTLIDKVMATQLLILTQRAISKPYVFKFIRKTLNPNHPKNNTFHPAVCLIRKIDYWNIGGCEEDLVGHYGYTDPCFWHRAQSKINVIYNRNIILRYDEEGEADIQRDSSHNEKIFIEKKKK